MIAVRRSYAIKGAFASAYKLIRNLRVEHRIICEEQYWSLERGYHHENTQRRPHQELPLVAKERGYFRMLRVVFHNDARSPVELLQHTGPAPYPEARSPVSPFALSK